MTGFWFFCWIVEAAVTGGGVSKKKGKGKGSVSATECNYDDYKLEYAKSSRSACFACEDKIAKMEVRISKLDYNSEKVIAMGRGPVVIFLSSFIL